MNIPDEAVETAAKYLSDRFFWDGPLLNEVAREVLEAAAPHMRETVTEWAAGFPDAAYPYNYHRTREEAQKFVSGMEEVGADMVVMTREVLPSEESEWIPATTRNPYRSQA